MKNKRHWTVETIPPSPSPVLKWIPVVCLVTQSCLIPWNPMDCSPPGSSVYGILQARILEWVAMLSSRGSSWTRDQTHFSCICRWILYHCKWLLMWNIYFLYKPNNFHQIRSVSQSCPTLCDPVNHSTPGLPVHHQLPEFTQTHVHRVIDAIQPSHPLSSPSPLAPNPSQHQSLFQWVNSSHEVAKVLEFQL